MSTMTITIERQASNRYRVWEGQCRGPYKTRVFPSFAAIARRYGFSATPRPDFTSGTPGVLATVTISGLRLGD